jgi:hypothetical protein
LQEHRPRRNQRNQHVRVDGKLIHAISVLLIVRGKLIRLAGRRDEMFDGLTVVAPAESRTTFA